MSIAVLAHVQEMTTENFDAASEKLGEEPPQGMLAQTVGPAEAGGLHFFSVWETREHFDRFREEVLLPALREVLGEEAVSNLPRAEVYELHDLYIKPPA